MNRLYWLFRWMFNPPYTIGSKVLVLSPFDADHPGLWTIAERIFVGFGEDNPVGYLYKLVGEDGKLALFHEKSVTLHYSSQYYIS